ncbi:MAG: hypothetical protein IKB98_01870, partial [Clostridia bacterium]|nr:hypothetical protein [Clostridia bacterium]
MKQETINKRVDNAIRRYIPNESDKVKQYMRDFELWRNFMRLLIISEINNDLSEVLKTCPVEKD